MKNTKNRVFHPRILSVLLTVLMATGLWACGDQGTEAQGVDLSADGVEVDGLYQQYRDSVDGPHADHRAMHEITIFDAAGAQRYFDEEGIGQFEYPDAFKQVGLRLQAESVEELAFRAQLKDGSWTNWEPVNVYWSEGTLHNGLILVDEPTTVIELSGGDQITFAQMEFFPEVIARAELVEGEQPEFDEVREPGQREEDVRTVQQAVAPTSMVTTRSQWNATNPGKICGNVVNPYRMAIHHTASPSSDGNLYATMRGMQNYHMNNNGWCDIGYHFVVAQSGEILQGRSRSNRPGAHVGGQNSGNVGISMIGNYTSSTPPSIQLDGVATMVRWVHDTHGVAMNRTAVKGHREHAGASTSCPGNQGLAQLDEILSRAGGIGAPEPEPEPDYDVDFQIKISGLDDFYQQGTSETVPDAFKNEQFTADIFVTNRSDEAIRGVEVSYAFDGYGVEATSYRIDTDHPHYNQKDWQVNSAHEAPENPAHTDMGTSGTLVMHAFSPNETKRVRIQLQTTQYNIGFADFRGVRGWVKNIDGVYAQSSYGGDPSTNVLGYRLRDTGRVDVLSRGEWQFQAGQTDDLEGWTGAGPHDRLAINTSHDLLAQRVTGLDARIVSPVWTRIDADSYDELVLRVRSHDGDHTKALYWAREGEEFNERQKVEFQAAGDSEFHTLVIPVGAHAEWSGEIHRFRIDSNEDLEVLEEDSGWYDYDHIYFQNRATASTTSHNLGVVDQEPVDVDLGLGEPSTPGSDTDRPIIGDSPDPEADGSRDDIRAEGRSGCSAASGGSPGTGWLLVAMALGLVALRRSSLQETAANQPVA